MLHVSNFPLLTHLPSVLCHVGNQENLPTANTCEASLMLLLSAMYCCSHGLAALRQAARLQLR